MKHLLPKINLDFLKDNKQVFLSVAVIILVPALVILNTYNLLKESRRIVDVDLKDKAIMVGQGANVFIAEGLDGGESVESRIQKYSEAIKNVKDINIYQKEGQSFKLVAGMGEGDASEIPANQKTPFVLAWYDEQDTPYAFLGISDKTEQIGDKTIRKGERFWRVILPLKNSAGEKVYLTEITVSVDKIDVLFAATARNTIFFTTLIIIAIVVMVFVNGQLFQYSILFNKLKEVDEMKDDFISVASHELRTPLTAIKGYLGMILEDIGTGHVSKKDQKEMLEMAMFSAERLNSLVGDILDVSRIEQGRIQINTAPQDLTMLTKEAVKGLKVEAEKKGLKIKESYATEELVSSVDKDKYTQVLVNLLGNAIKYSEKGIIEVILERSDDQNKVRIKDTGIGMNEEERKNLFTKFYRVQNEKTRNVTGTGLGLWITKQMVVLMQGEIMVDSIKDVGSEFTVSFPAAKKEIVKSKEKPEVKVRIKS